MYIICINEMYRFWPRNTDVNSLFKVESSFIHSDITLIQDPCTGTFDDYCEVSLINICIYNFKYVYLGKVK